MSRRSAEVEAAKQVALEVLINNARDGRGGLPRTAAWGYPEPYTRDLMIVALGALVTENAELRDSLRRTLEALAETQSEHGCIASLCDVPEDLGASDTTPLFLIALSLYRKVARKPRFLAQAEQNAQRWMRYQSPGDNVIVAQQPTSDWRDEQWVEGYGLFVNTLTYAALKLHKEDARASKLKLLMSQLDVREQKSQRHVHRRLSQPDKPYLSLWAYKVHTDEHFDLLGNSLAILTGLVTPARSKQIIGWVEKECAVLRKKRLLAVDLPPCFFPYTQPGDPDWHPRYARYNKPGDYHNGGIWPFVCGFYVAALVAAGQQRLAEQKLLALTELVRPARKAKVSFGFNEWIKAQDGQVRGQDWQSWSAAMYLYAAECVSRGKTPFFDELRRPQA
jgi:Alkaline and neutral invertase